MTAPLDQLLAAFADLLSRTGRDAFLAAPILLHDRRHFPDPWTSDLIGVRRAIRRMLLHAALPDLQVVLHDERSDERDQAEPGTYLVDFDANTVQFVVTSIPAPHILVSAIALEVARLWISQHDPTAAAPYRRERGEEPDLADDHVATLAMFALGFGAIAVNGSAMMLKAESLQGGYVVGRWQQLAVGDLSPAAAETLLAVQLVVRDVEGAALDAIAASLEAAHRGGVLRQVDALRPRADELRGRLRLPARDLWPAPREIDVELVSDDAIDDALRSARVAERVRLPNVGQIVFRARPRRTLGGMALGAVVGVIGGLLVPVGGAFVFAAGLVAGLVMGRWSRDSRCSEPECNRWLRASDTTCPGCGGRIAGEIAHRDERLAAVERLETNARGDAAES